MHTLMICRFCKKPAIHKPIAEASAIGMEIYFCFDCNAEYTASFGKQDISYSIYTIINDKLYQWSTGGATSYLFFIGSPGIPGLKLNERLKLVTHLDSDLLEVTPYNITSKIKTILLFL